MFSREGMTALAAVIFLISAVSAARAFPWTERESGAEAARHVLNAAAKKKPSTREAQCKALSKCRNRYAWCEKKYYKQQKPGPKRDAALEACVDKYRTCIKANFEGTDLLFIRWFWPDECPY
jgi:hypothetical protein